MTSALLGAALQAGKLESLDQSIVETLGVDLDDLNDPTKRNITLAHLVSMRSGLNCGLQPGEQELIAMMATTDWPTFALSLPLADPPDARFAYCSPGMHLLSAAISAVTQQNAKSFAQTGLFGPIGVHPGEWPADPTGHSHGWGDLRLHPHDMAKFGFLFLHGGQWDGTPILPVSWMSEATSSRGLTGVGDDGYGYGWWVLGGTYEGVIEARGRGGQSIVVWPEQDLVVVMTGGGVALAELAPFLVDAIKSTEPLPENDQITEGLQAALAAARAGPKPQGVKPRPPLAAAVSGLTYDLQPNPLGLEAIGFDFTNHEDAVLVLEMSSALAASAAGRSEMTVGLDGRYRFTPKGPRGYRVGLRGEWKDKDLFEMHYAEPAGPNSFEFHARFDADRIHLSVRDKTKLYDDHELKGQAQR